jgi:hypothetical protein
MVNTDPTGEIVYLTSGFSHPAPKTEGSCRSTPVAAMAHGVRADFPRVTLRFVVIETVTEVEAVTDFVVITNGSIAGATFTLAGSSEPGHISRWVYGR